MLNLPLEFDDGKPVLLAPVLKWLKVLLKEDRKGYANCATRINLLTELNPELRGLIVDYRL
jgi:hypothetical protein